MSEFVVIVGMSGAGRTSAADTFEDLGWFVIDNLPTQLMPKVGELAAQPGSEIDRVVLVAGNAQHLHELPAALDALTNTGVRVRLVFLEASDNALVARYGSTRRPHPLPQEDVIRAIGDERRFLASVKERADLVIDTSEMNVHQLRHRINDLFATSNASGLKLSIMSFGFKNGLPNYVDIVLDARFLPNPYWVPELRPKSGRDEPVKAYVLGQPEAEAFLEHVGQLLELSLPAYEREGKAYLTVAIGCTGGKHRSVALAEELAARLRAHGYESSVSHRDLSRAE